MKKIFFNQRSFIAWVDYYSKTNELFIVMRKTGKKFIIRKFPESAFRRLENANNKGSHVSIYILNNDKYSVEFVQYIPLADVENETKLNSKPFLNFLAR